METVTQPLYKVLNEKRTQGHLRQGYTLMTSQTKQWSKTAIDDNDKREGKMLFVNFNESDNGRSRNLIANFQKIEDAQYAALAVNNLHYLAEALEGVIRVADRKTIEFDKAKEALKRIS